MTEAQYHTLIKDMPAAERPRERLIYHGAEVLSNAELLAITLRVGSPSENVVSLAQRLLSQFDGLGGLARASVAELCTIPGIGPAKATQLKAALELGKRMASYGEATRPRITCPDDAAPRFIAAIGDGQQEQFCVLHLDNKNAIIRMSMVYQGSVNAAVMRLGEVFREAVRDNAVRVIVAHNHPSGDLTPSPEDIQATREIVKAGKLLDIEVLDHLIIGPRDHLSLRSLGLGFG
ncbi:MAG TPA: DNA repair protein RadC [Chloroflexi bacterium]|jgi:DNA repair protein RadC|nr:DNA repair protein RadC [Chloroflexota bacterium]